jgi:hypothetical protein
VSNLVVVLLVLVAIRFREIGQSFVKSFGLAAVARDLGGIAGARVSAGEDCAAICPSK